MFTKFREPVSGLTHLFAAFASLVALTVVFFISNEAPTSLTALLIYGASLIMMFSASAAYHLVRARNEVIVFLRKMDHSAIYLLIAGTYTPVCIHFFNGFWQSGMLILVWSIAAAGIIFKLFIINAPRWVSTCIYLLMGWLALLAFGQIWNSFPSGALMWLFMGGLFFTAGAVIYAIKKPDFYPGVFGFHEVWHIFVILGCLCHFVLISAYT